MSYSGIERSSSSDGKNTAPISSLWSIDTIEVAKIISALSILSDISL